MLDDSTNRRTVNDDGPKTAACRCRGWVVAYGRGQNEGRRPCRSIDGWSQRAVFATSNARYSCSDGVCSACGSAGMEIDCVLASMMASTPDGGERSGGDGGGGVGGKPCRRWGPSWWNGGPPWIQPNCVAARALCSGSFRESDPSRASSMGGCLLRGCFLARRPSQRVAPVTQRRIRCRSRGPAPFLSLCLSQANPLVSTDLFLGPGATQPCRRAYHQ